MPYVGQMTLGQQLAREIKDPTTVEIITELVAEWISGQSFKYRYFDDGDPCRCGDSEGIGDRPEHAMENLAAFITADKVIPGHNSGECRDADDDDDDDDDDDEEEDED